MIRTDCAEFRNPPVPGMPEPLARPEESNHPTQRMVPPFPVFIDAEIAAIIAELWQRGVITTHSCQGDPDGFAGYVSFYHLTYPERFANAGSTVCEVLRKHGKEVVDVGHGSNGNGLTVRFRDQAWFEANR